MPTWVRFFFIVTKYQKLKSFQKNCSPHFCFRMPCWSPVYSRLFDLPAGLQYLNLVSDETQMAMSSTLCPWKSAQSILHTCWLRAQLYSLTVNLNGGRTRTLLRDMRHLTRILPEEKVAHLPMEVDPRGTQWQRPILETKVFKLRLPNSSVPFQSNQNQRNAEAIIEVLAFYCDNKIVLLLYSNFSSKVQNFPQSVYLTHYAEEPLLLIYLFACLCISDFLFVCLCLAFVFLHQM